MSEMIVIEPPFGSPVVADPSFLPPKDTPDNKFHLFGHSIWGIHHYVSEDGKKWKNHKFVRSFSVRPFIFKESGVYHLFYEKLKLIVPFTKIYFSEIKLVTSKDLKNWSKPKTIFKPIEKWHGWSVSNPCVVRVKGGYKLHYNANQKYFWDCLFTEPRFSGVAFSKKIDGFYKNITKEPDRLIHHVLRIFDKNIFETKWYKDSFGKTRSAVFLNGKEFIKPGEGWMKSFVYVCDAKKVGTKTYIYFNARNGWFWGKERIGLKIVG